MSGPLAVWRTDSRFESDLKEEGRRSLHQRLSAQAFAIACILAPFASFVPSGDLTFFRSLVATGVVLCLGILSLVLAARAGSVRRRNARRIGGEYAIQGGFLAKVTVLMGEATLGSDHGIVWSEDGRLYFAGPRTSFGLFASQIDPSSVEEEETTLRLPLRVASRLESVSLRFAVLPKGKELGDAQQQAQFTWMVRSWQAQESVGEGQMPPLTLGPDAPGAEVLFFQAIGATLYWAALPFVALGFVAIVVATSCFGVLLLPLVIAALKAGMRAFAGPADGWLAWHDRRRLGRETA